ncbi:hypothetical protein ECANGB1_1710 [Enterospora canceri]|uniref:Uncharacterized protein n=1 Tax=Enterospora canceri TaxID=1081671 RepID=A0A1Y1SA02_9MICR|nr:hypothetical protein ECANGB1_1710 [Enterospora canceri]
MTKQPEARQIIQYNKKSIRKMKNVVGDAESALSLTAMQVLVFYLVFILMVFGCHLACKLMPNASPIQLFVAVIAISCSIGFSAWYKQK